MKIRPKSSDISTQHCGPKQDILIKLYQKELRQLLGYGIYMIMLMILTFNKDPKSITPSSGFFQLYRSEGIITQSQLKYACATSLIATLICLSGSYLHMQLMSKFTSFYKKFQSLSQDHLIIIFGSSSTSLSAHQIHKMLPANSLLDSGISNPSILQVISNPSILQVISNSLSENLALFSTNLSSTGKLLNPSTRSVFLSQVAAHHKTTGVVFITLGLIRFLTMYNSQFSINCIFINNSS